MTLKEAILAANAADEAFSTALTNAGYKSRWDWNQFFDPATLEVREAYDAKVSADNAMHDAFLRARLDAQALKNS